MSERRRRARKEAELRLQSLIGLGDRVSNASGASSPPGLESHPSGRAVDSEARRTLGLARGLHWPLAANSIGTQLSARNRVKWASEWALCLLLFEFEFKLPLCCLRLLLLAQNKSKEETL